MGSLDPAFLSGFVCRLCSKLSSCVIHIYSSEGDSLRLSEKINTYLPIKIDIHDPLPKTVCGPCIDRLQSTHELMQKFIAARKRAMIMMPGLQPKVLQPLPEPPDVN